MVLHRKLKCVHRRSSLADSAQGCWGAVEGHRNSWNVLSLGAAGALATSWLLLLNQQAFASTALWHKTTKLLTAASSHLRELTETQFPGRRRLAPSDSIPVLRPR
ncbi:hypothetical protein J1614_002729 [Plenodomus biglobosus]|nr:hypothetical protein J1614_002729 [Plenodomus biglobosus]